VFRKSCAGSSGSYGTSVRFCQTTRCHIPEENTFTFNDNNDNTYHEGTVLLPKPLALLYIQHLYVCVCVCLCFLRGTSFFAIIFTCINDLTKNLACNIETTAVIRRDATTCISAKGQRRRTHDLKANQGTEREEVAGRTCDVCIH
jgi:hypothetical protein